MKSSLLPSWTRILFCVLLLAPVAFLQSCDEDKDDEQTQETAQPTSFNLIFISDNATDVVFSPYLSWTASTDPNGGSITYQVLLDKTGDLTSAGETEPSTVLEENISTNYYAMTDALDQGTEYTWRVVAFNEEGGSTKSTNVFSFITAENGTGNNPPAPFNLFSPMNGATDVPLSPQLTWEQAVDPDGDPVFYDVYLEDYLSGGSGLISSMNPNLSTTPISLNYDTDYIWEVLAYDSKGAYRWSDSLYFFTTMAEPSQGNLTLVTENAPFQSTGRFGHQSVVHNGELYVIGGFVLDNGDGGDWNDVWKTSDGTNWTQVRAHDVFDLNAPHPSSESQVLSYAGLLYVFNGERNTIQTSADGVSWEQLPWEGSVSEGTHYGPVQGHQVVEFEGNLYLIGGSSGGLVNNDVWVSYDFGITWTEVSDHSFPARRDHQVVVLDDVMYIIGGVAGGQRLNDVWTSVDGMNWVEEPEVVPDPIMNHQCTAFNGDIYLTGGDKGGDSDEIWVLDGWTGEWQALDIQDPYGPRESHSTVVFNNTLYIMMGKDGALPVNDIWKIQ